MAGFTWFCIDNAARQFFYLALPDSNTLSLALSVCSYGCIDFCAQAEVRLRTAALGGIAQAAAVVTCLASMRSEVGHGTASICPILIHIVRGSSVWSFSTDNWYYL